MKKLILFLAITLGIGKVSAQSGISNNTPNIIYKPDTMLYLIKKYKVAVNSKVDQLLKVMEGFEIAADGSFSHQGLLIKKIKINGKTYDSLEISTAIKKIPANAVANIEMIDDYNNLSSLNHWTAEPDKLLNIIIQANKLPEINYLLSKNNNITVDGQKITIIRLDCRDYAAELLGPIIANMNGETSPDVDDYGDQIPHFLIKPSPGSYISKATKY